MKAEAHSGDSKAEAGGKSEAVQVGAHRGHSERMIENLLAFDGGVQA